jgi:hypothetical protein
MDAIDEMDGERTGGRVVGRVGPRRDWDRPRLGAGQRAAAPGWPMEDVRHCVRLTLDDLARSIRRGHPITRPNLRRLFERRWARTARERRHSMGPAAIEAGRLSGRAMIEREYATAWHGP